MGLYCTQDSSTLMSTLVCREDIRRADFLPPNLRESIACVLLLLILC